jgi:flagellar biosynthesis component FlhA
MQNKSSSLDTMVAVAVFTLIFLLVIPLPPLLLDVLLCVNLVLSVMALLLTLYVERALDFSAFPSLLLFLTLFRLGLNVASTRMILTQGTGGALIATFGEFVTSGNLFVGVVIFVLLTCINFFVVTKGAGRVAEVAARFMLEALPGKQMAIDSDVQAGALDHDQARAARLEVGREAEFYGAMDGASKFVKGDALAGLMITGINAVGGIVFGLFLKGYSLLDSLQIFTRLTVGDGLVSQIPALLISIGAGIMVTRASHESVAQSLGQQLFSQPKVFLYTGMCMGVLCFVPGMPVVVLLPMAGALTLYSRVLQKHAESGDQPGMQKSSRLELLIGKEIEGWSTALFLELPHLSYSLSKKFGVPFPVCRVGVSENLEGQEFCLLFRELPILKGTCAEMADLMEACEQALVRLAPQLVHRQWVSDQLDGVKKFDKAVIDELIPHKMKVGDVAQLLSALLKEQVPIRDLDQILESAADFISRNPGGWRWPELVEHVRFSLSDCIKQHFFGHLNQVRTITIDPKVEQMVIAGVKNEKVVLRAASIEEIYARTEKLLERGSRNIVVLTAPKARASLRQILEGRFPSLPVIAHHELREDIEVEEVGSLGREVL